MRTDLEPIDLTPQQREVVRYYTDPLLPTFGNKTQSALAAGYATTGVFDTESVQAEIARVEAQRAMAHEEVREFMGDFAGDAARALVRTLGLLSSLRIEDPNALTGGPTDEERATAEEMHDTQKTSYKATPKYPTVEDALGALVDARLKRADVITKANRVSLQAFKEAREAAELLLRYTLGHPEQRVRHTDEREDPFDLSKYTNEEILDLGQALERALETRKATVQDPDDDPSVVEGDWEEG